MSRTRSGRVGVPVAPVDPVIHIEKLSVLAVRMLGDAGPAPHNIDVMVLGGPELVAVFKACARIEAAVHRPVNPTIFTPEEFAAPSA